MGFGWGEYPPYVSVAARRAQAARKLAALRKAGKTVSPVQVAGRKIATTFWGSAWCTNLESYSDYAKVSKLILNLNISTTHVGDLVVWLQSPDGSVSVLHDSEGAGAHDLIFTDKDLTSAFSGAVPNGKWQLKVQDRLKGDLATVNSFKLEVGTD